MPAGSPAIIASVGTLSGPIGAQVAGMVAGVRVWVRAVNARGGVNGHPVRLLTYDDGADPARHRAQVQQAIERDHAIAFVGNPEGATGHSSVEYITSKRVPVIGSEGAGSWFYNSPMYFPEASHHSELFYGALASAAQQLIPAGKTRLGIIACAEAQACDEIGDFWAQSAKGLGLEAVYDARASLATPDFTAQCLAARNAGAQIFMTVFDQASVSRLAAACVRQNYRPTYGTLGSGAHETQKNDPNLAGMIASTNVFPYFQSGTPATDEYQQAFRTYGAGVVNEVAPATGWVSGKVFEKAAQQLPEPPSAEAVLKGLWSLKDETLGGITQPLRFIPEKPAPRMACWFNLVLKESWSSPDGFKFQCRK